MKYALLAAIFFYSLAACSQESESHKHTEQAHTARDAHEGSKNEVMLYYGSTYFFRSGFNLPTVGLDYSRKVNGFMAVGLILDYEIGSHVIQVSEHDTVGEANREGAILLLPMMSFRVVADLTMFAGYGVEFERSETLGLLRAGIGYKVHFKNPKFMVEPYFAWDHTTRYDALVYGVSFGIEF